MAYNYNPLSGILAAPSTITNPLQNPLTPEGIAAMEAANAQERIKRAAVQQAMYRAAALREDPGMHIRQGQGPMGWATSLGDAVAGIINKKRQDEATKGVTGAIGELPSAETASFDAYNALRRKKASEYVSQGSPLSLGDQ